MRKSRLFACLFIYPVLSGHLFNLRITVGNTGMAYIFMDPFGRCFMSGKSEIENESNTKIRFFL